MNRHLLRAVIDRLASVRRRIAQLVFRRRLEMDLDEEIRTHIELATEEYLRQGMAPEEASRAARRDFGARAADVRGMVLKRGMLLTGAGVLLGIPVAAVSPRVMTSLLYGVEPTDPATFAGGAALLLCVSFSATWLPARNASRTSPMVVLRRE